MARTLPLTPPTKRPTMARRTTERVCRVGTITKIDDPVAERAAWLWAIALCLEAANRPDEESA